MNAVERHGREKVAIVLLALGNAMGTKLLQKFDAGDIKAILDSASSLGTIAKDDLELLVDEFAAQFARTLGLSTSFDQVKSLVESAFSPAELSTMLGGQAAPGPVPVWQRFGAGSENTLVPYLLDQHPQIIALILSKIDAGLAARCMSMLPREIRDAAAKRLLKLQPVSDEALALVGSCLESDLLTKADVGLEDEGRKRLADLLNKLDRDQSGAILESLGSSRPEEARKLRTMIFSFEDIDRLPQRSRLTLFDKLQTEQVIAALKGTTPEFKEIVLSSLGARARRMVEAELANDTGQVTKETLAIRRTIADMVLSLAAQGEISLPDADGAAEPVAA